MELQTLVHTLFSLLTLTFLEIILGIDNLVFIAVSTNRLPKSQQARARQFGLIFALVTRLLLLAGVFWLAKLTEPLFTIVAHPVSVRDLIMLCGGVFLIYKGTLEVHNEVAEDLDTMKREAKSKMAAVIMQIGILDIVFSLDSVITAVGMTNQYWVMATAICIAIATMLFLSNPLGEFVEKNPTVKMLALSFIIMVGMVLLAEGLAYHVPRGYLYFSISFSLFVEFMNTLVRMKRTKRPQS